MRIRWLGPIDIAQQNGRIPRGADTETSSIPLFDHLDFGAMANGKVRYDRYSIFADHGRHPHSESALGGRHRGLGAACRTPVPLSTINECSRILGRSHQAPDSFDTVFYCSKLRSRSSARLITDPEICASAINRRPARALNISLWSSTSPGGT